MAGVTKLKLVFDTAAGNKTFTYNYIDTAAATSNAIKSVMNTMIANGDIFKYPPLQKVSASLETTTTTEISVRD